MYDFLILFPKNLRHHVRSTELALFQRSNTTSSKASLYFPLDSSPFKLNIRHFSLLNLSRARPIKNNVFLHMLTLWKMHGGSGLHPLLFNFLIIFFFSSGSFYAFRLICPALCAEPSRTEIKLAQFLRGQTEKAHPTEIFTVRGQ